MIFDHTIEKIFDNDRRKTRTARIANEGDYMENGVISSANDRIRWRIGGIYAVQPGRGKKGIAKIEVIDLGRQDVRQITDDEVSREGFFSKLEFWKIWTDMHDQSARKMIDQIEESARTSSAVVSIEELVQNTLNLRPIRHYDAWWLEFRLVDEMPPLPPENNELIDAGRRFIISSRYLHKAGGARAVQNMYTQLNALNAIIRQSQ